MGYPCIIIVILKIINTNIRLVYGELMEHFPLAVFSVAFGLALISLIGAQSVGQEANLKLVKKSAHILFHSFHFMHIVFAATGTVITFMRFSNSIAAGNSGWFNLSNHILYTFRCSASVFGRLSAGRAHAFPSLFLF